MFKPMIKIRLLRGVSLCKLRKLKTKVCGHKEESDNVPQTGGEIIYYYHYCCYCCCNLLTSLCSIVECLHVATLCILVLHFSWEVCNLTLCSVFRNWWTDYCTSYGCCLVIQLSVGTGYEILSLFHGVVNATLFTTPWLETVDPSHHLVKLNCELESTLTLWDRRFT
jgi:hypothetical protein